MGVFTGRALTWVLLQAGVVCQDLRAGCQVPASVSISTCSTVVEATAFPRYLWEARPSQASQEVLCSFRGTGYLLWALLLPLGNHGPRRSSLCGQPGGGLMAGCSCSSDPSHMVLRGLCGPGAASASALGSGMFTVVSCLWIAASWCSCEGD